MTELELLEIQRLSAKGYLSGWEKNADIITTARGHDITMWMALRVTVAQEELWAIEARIETLKGAQA